MRSYHLVKNDHGKWVKVDEDGFLFKPVSIQVELSEIIDVDFEGFLDLICERAGFGLLTELEYRVVGAKHGGIVIEVQGNVTLHEDMLASTTSNTEV